MDYQNWTLAWIALWSSLGAIIGNSRGRLAFGLVMGFILGPIGLLLIFVLPSLYKFCPFCKGNIPTDAVKCQKCGSDLRPKQPKLNPGTSPGWGEP